MSKDIYKKLKDTWSNKTKENFFVGYALNGAVVNHSGLRTGTPSLEPLCDSPVQEPSPLNTRWKYIPQTTYDGIF
jgi:hypothetical protein